MGLLRKNYNKCYSQVQEEFAAATSVIFTKQYEGKKCNNAIFIRALFCALCHIQSLFAVCRNLSNSPGDTAVAHAVLATLPAFHELQKRVNQVLAKGLPKNLLKSKQNFAIDLTLIPYYGKPLNERKEWDYRSQAKDGTNHFHAYATCYVVKQGFRYTIALTPVVKGEKMKDVIQRLMKQYSQAGVSCKLLLVDRGFYSVETISYMKHAQIPFVTPLVIRGKEATKNSPAGGTRK